MEVNYGSQSVDRQTDRQTDRQPDRQTLSVLFMFSHKLLTFDQLMNKPYAVLCMRFLCQKDRSFIERFFLCFENQLFMEVY